MIPYRIQSRRRGLPAFVLAVLLASPAVLAGEAPVTTASPVAPASAGRPLPLAEAIAMALEKHEGIRIQRETVVSADANITGTKGVYDPQLEIQADWRKTRQPVNSSFSGAPEGRPAPTTRAAEGVATVTQYLPTGATVSAVAGTARATTDGTFDLLSPAYSTRIGLEARQPLLRDRSIDPSRLAIRVAAANRRRAGASLAREVSDTVAAVERVYWTLVAARREVAVREQAVGLAGEQVNQTTIRIEQGVTPRTESAQPRAELERRRGELLAAGEAVSRAENELKLLILADGDADLWAAHLDPADGLEIDPEPVDVAASLEQALASRPELAAAQALIDRRRLESEQAHDAVLPALDAVVTYDRFGFAGQANPALEDFGGTPTVIPEGMEGRWGRSFSQLGEDRFNDVRAGLVFRIPIGNRTARAGEAIARSTERQAEADLSWARKNVRADVLDAVATLETAAQRIDAARAGREAAEVQLSSEVDRYGAGLSTNFLVLTRQNDLSRARLDEIAARTDYRKAAAELGRARGSLLEERGIELEP